MTHYITATLTSGLLGIVMDDSDFILKGTYIAEKLGVRFLLLL